MSSTDGDRSVTSYGLQSPHHALPFPPHPLICQLFVAQRLELRDQALRNRGFIRIAFQ